MFLESRANDFSGTPAQARFDLPLGMVKTFTTCAHLDSAVMANPDSFIAVSYSWHNTDWSTSEVLTDIKSPLILEMWRMLLKLRKSTHEGIWIDQLCIEQGDKREKM
jgi:hypothetical protein